MSFCPEKDPGTPPLPLTGARGPASRCLRRAHGRCGPRVPAVRWRAVLRLWLLESSGQMLMAHIVAITEKNYVIESVFSPEFAC